MPGVHKEVFQEAKVVRAGGMGGKPLCKEYSYSWVAVRVLVMDSGGG